MQGVMAGKRRFRLSVRKYQETKKPPSLIVSIKITRDLSILTVSLPRELYVSCPVDTLSALKARLDLQPLPPRWFLSSSCQSSLFLFKVQHQEKSVEVSFSLNIDEHLHWSINIRGRLLSALTSPTLAVIPSVLNSIPHALQLLTFLDSCRLCIGNSKQKLTDVVRHRESIQQGITLARIIVYWHV